MDRIALRYLGGDPASLSAGQGSPTPALVEHGVEFTVDADWAEVYLARVDVELVDADEVVPHRLLGPNDVGPADELKGAALADALTDLGLPHTGSADEQRARIAAAQSTEKDA